ncbi:ATP-binding protein [Halobacterium sp. R2-5]|uniref:ATP-binding protein n=1 Tax=Halobacterium sp. R2-5 TaxID=2715751 RepID=UPI00141E8D99|nr:ATP-binding protein [Halobacterium sp. R2-5]NIC01082.1 ATP-binding protein [Halobacterium sp. R2-5]
MSDQQSDQTDPHIVAGYREHVDGYDERDPDAYPHTALVRDSDISRFLAVVEQEYDPDRAKAAETMPGQARDLELARNLRRMEATDAGRQAVADGDMTTLQHQQGNTNQRADISGVKAIEQVDELINGAAPVVVILGEMGAGKSQFATLLGQRYVHRNPSALVGTNIKSLREKSDWRDARGQQRDGYLPSFPALKEWLQQDGNPLHHDQTPKLAILDELSSEASGSGKDGQLTRKLMGPLVFKVRKYGGALIVIAHDESSIHPLLWRLGVIVKKESKKKASIWERVTNGQLRGKVGEFEGVPKSDWDYNDKEASSWSWQKTSDDSDEPEVAEMDVKRVSMWTIAQGMESGRSPREIAENVPYTHTTVRNWWEEYQDGGEKREWVSDVEAAIA